MDNRVIWKFALEITDSQTIQMPCGAEVLTIQTQQEKPFIWALVNPQEEIVNYEFLMLGTEHPIDAADIKWGIHVGTFQIHGGALVFHVFNMGEVNDDDDETDMQDRG